MRETYVADDGKTINMDDKNKKWIKRNLIILGIIILIVLIFFISRTIIRSNYCGKIIGRVTDASLKYTKENKTIPMSEGDFVTLELEDLLKNDLLTEANITVNKKVATGKIKITKYKNDYITTVDLKDCDYCDTSKKKWTKESTKKPNKQVVDSIAYYNYHTKTNNYTDWTKWYENSDLKTKVDKKYNIRLPEKDNNLPVIPKDSVIDTIEQETKEYYRFRDKRWAYYKGGGNYTDYFSSEQPAGFEKADASTLTYTEWTDYSLNYPEKKPYREIVSQYGYKWYYTENGKKTYYKNGEYAVEAIGDKKYQKDTKAGNASMYRSRDKQWRWYTGARRIYGPYASVLPKGYTNRDDGLMRYTAWSNWKEVTNMATDNASYREEEVSTKYRYRIKYNVVSLAVLPKPITKTSLENELHMTVDEILARDDLKVDITYKFRYKK